MTGGVGTDPVGHAPSETGPSPRHCHRETLGDNRGEEVDGGQPNELGEVRAGRRSVDEALDEKRSGERYDLAHDEEPSHPGGASALGAKVGAEEMPMGAVAGVHGAKRR